MEQNNDIIPAETIERPQFLKVLCILTFIGCGLGILGSVFGWWSLKTLSALMENDPDMFDQQMNSPWANPESTMLAMKFMNENLITGVLGSILCLVGAILMWQLKKTGFYIYLIGEMGPVVVGFILMGSAMLSGWSILGLVIPVLFSVLYAINFKHLK
jgi:hypothetical protein